MITGLVICRNEEKNIGDCLRSLQWCDELIVIDAFSDDSTVQISEKFTSRIYQNEWKGFREQRIFALSKVEKGWIFSLDADERCTVQLANEIRQRVSIGMPDADGYLIPRKNFFLGKWIKHGGWYPGYQMRLFRSDKAGVSERLVHESYTVDGTLGKLNSDIEHFTVTSVDDYMKKIIKYAELSALEKRNSEAGFYRLFIYPRLEFAKQYFIKGSFLDGKEGLMIANFHMITKALTYMKIAEMQKK